MAEIVVEYADVISWDTGGGALGHEGVSFKKNGGTPELATAVAEASGASAVQTYTYADFSPPVASGDVVTVHYSSAGNTLMDSSGKRLKDLQNTAVNCLDGPTALSGQVINGNQLQVTFDMEVSDDGVFGANCRSSITAGVRTGLTVVSTLLELVETG